MEKIISIGGKDVGFKATSSTTLRYREKFNRDLFADIQGLMPKMGEDFESADLDCFLKIAYIMAWQYDRTIPDDPYDWLDEFEMFDIYKVLPQIVELWGLNTQQLEKPKKKAEEQSGR